MVPYAYQQESINFGLYKKAVLIGDEMGLGKTLQAIGLSILKKDIFGFRKVLVVTMSSLKQQWQREIERFSNEKACVITGSAQKRKEQYATDESLFKITNYKAVLRDVTIISRLKPDLIILDEAQRIKNFETKTAEAVKSLPRQHAIILTGTPLENKLEDVYSLVQFLDPELLSPLWQFAADHFLLGRRKKGDILGYVNLNSLHDKLKPLVIRRRKEVVLDELANILDELIKQNGRKVVIFSEWTAMTMLIGKHLSREQIPLVELSGKVPVVKRQALIDEFDTNPDCKVFLSTDAGGTGLNLQAADCVVNFELPWNPAKVNQRVGRVNRIGQRSKCINVINLIAKYSIEERIMAGIKLKGDLFDGVFDGGKDEVMLSREKRQEMVNQLREMMGEEAEMVQVEPLPKEELAEDTPHFLNPSVLRNEVDVVAEENVEPFEEHLPQEELHEPAGKSTEQMEEVLNQGMGFISGLLEMATGQKLGIAKDGKKMVSLDKKTGEVTLKFTLPGFPKS